MYKRSIAALLLASALLSGAGAEGEFVTPYDFGAVGDGTTDDTAALQSAIDSQQAVTLPHGTFRITSRLNLPAGTVVTGPATVLHDFDASPPPGAPSSNDVALYVSGSDVRLEGFTIAKTFLDGSYSVGILASNVSDLTIKDLDISGYSARYGIHIVESEDFEVTGCYIHDFMANTTTDMIADSPAGLRVTRSKQGLVSNNRIVRIEVGEVGLESISPLVPDYGPQGYQSDCMTIMQSEHIAVNGNVCLTSGEAIDMLLSKSCTVSNNVLSDIWFQGVKMLGVSYCTVSENFISDCYQGIGLVSHPNFNAEASGNTVNGNVLRDIGSPGSFGVPGPGRVPFSSVYGILLHDEDCRFNVVTDNVIIDTQEIKTTEAGVHNGGTDNLVSDNIFTSEMTME